jgi:hypothetical protein
MSNRFFDRKILMIKEKIVEKLILGLTLLLSLNVYAEVYRWRDAAGKVHFGDQKPKATAENITEKVKSTNVDTSTSEHQKLESVFRKENDADREYQQQQKQAQYNPERQRQCSEAKDYLNKISGRVQFLDEKGQIVNVTEAERKQRAEAMQKLIKEKCPH